MPIIDAHKALLFYLKEYAMKKVQQVNQKDLAKLSIKVASNKYHKLRHERLKRSEDCVLSVKKYLTFLRSDMLNSTLYYFCYNSPKSKTYSIETRYWKLNPHICNLYKFIVEQEKHGEKLSGYIVKSIEDDKGVAAFEFVKCINNFAPNDEERLKVQQFYNLTFPLKDEAA